MKYSIALKRVFESVLVFSFFISASVFAGDPLITASFSGIWDQPEQESQGIILQIGEQEDDEKIGIAYWFTYGPDLKTSWYLGVGPVVGNEIEMVLYTASDIGFMAENIEGNEEVQEVGFLNLVFKNCNHGTATYAFDEVNDVIDEGEFPIKRISSIYRQRCSGGISDDTPSGGKPMQMDVSLMPATDDGSGEGKAKFWERTDRSDFMVEAEDIPDGSYTLKICGDNEDPDVQMFDMPVVNGEGKLEFRSPEIDAKLNLSFDPRGCKIEILEGDVVVLTSGENVLSEKQTGKPDKDKGEKITIEADLTSTGVVEGAKGEAEFEMEMDESEFSVKVKDVPVGFYSVEVAGVSKGEVEVVDDDGDFEGRVKFSDPQKAGNLLLDFDPRGEIVEIRQTTGDEPEVILEVVPFPDE